MLQVDVETSTDKALQSLIRNSILPVFCVVHTLWCHTFMPVLYLFQDVAPISVVSYP